MQFPSQQIGGLSNPLVESAMQIGRIDPENGPFQRIGSQLDASGQALPAQMHRIDQCGANVLDKRFVAQNEAS